MSSNGIGGTGAPNTNESLTARWQGALMDNFGTPRVPFVRGEGVHLWDADGKRYTDLLGGIAVNSLGQEEVGDVAEGADLPGDRRDHGRVQHSLLLEIFTDEGIGTMVVPDADNEPIITGGLA